MTALINDENHLFLNFPFVIIVKKTLKIHFNFVVYIFELWQERQPYLKMSPPPVQSGKKVGARDLVNGAILQCIEAASLGMPFEVRIISLY
jgi:hypothetical protein